jgi:MFS-type transporter involved in bile tolerance (Atg22 family)
MRKITIFKQNELAAVVVVVAAIFLVLAVPATITTPAAPAAQAQLPPLSPEQKQEGVDVIMNGTISSQIRLNQTAQTLIAQDPQFKTFTELWVKTVSTI